MIRLIVFVLLVAALPAAALAQTPRSIGMIVEMRGSVAVARDGIESTITSGAALFPDDVVRTAENARCIIELEDGTTLRLGAATEIALADYTRSGDGRSATLQLLFGIVRLLVPDNIPGDLGVITRAGLASARSTDFSVEIDNEAMATFVFDGTVLVGDHLGAVVPLEDGDGVDIPIGEGLGEVVQWGQARIDGVIERTSL